MVPNLGALSISGDRGSTLHTASAAGMDELSREGGLQTAQSPQQWANTIGATGCQSKAPPCHCASCQRGKLRHLLALLDLLLKQKTSHGSNPAPGSITWQKNTAWLPMGELAAGSGSLGCDAGVGRGGAGASQAPRLSIPSPSHPHPLQAQHWGGSDARLQERGSFAGRTQSAGSRLGPASWPQIKSTNRKVVQREPGSQGQAGSESSKLEDKTAAAAAGRPIFLQLKLQ